MPDFSSGLGSVVPKGSSVRLPDGSSKGSSKGGFDGRGGASSFLLASSGIEDCGLGVGSFFSFSLRSNPIPALLSLLSNFSALNLTSLKEDFNIFIALSAIFFPTPVLRSFNPSLSGPSGLS